MNIMRAGRVDSEQINLRGFSILDEDGKIHKRDMGLAPDGSMNDDAYYMKKAKEGR